ncbi:hypothetical protein G6F24_016774 [Rhizopus arrhizus]|nr:hypothetical protein G6F24_016774 [Rhizopus arrhizus]
MVFVPSCGCCNPCMEGRPALCEPGAAANTQGTLLGGDRRLHIGSEYINHHTGVSCFAEYAVVSRRSCVKGNVELSHREAALFGCAVLTGAGAVLNRARIKAGDRVLVDPIDRVDGGLVGETIHGGLAELCRVPAHQC